MRGLLVFPLRQALSLPDLCVPVRSLVWSYDLFGN